MQSKNEVKNMDTPLKGKVVLVTGAGRGIGKALAVGFGRAGAAVGCAARTETELKETAHEIEEDGGSALVLVTDVTEMDSVRAALSRLVEEYGGLDILVINAGGNLEPTEVEASDIERWKTTVDLNLMGAYHCAKAAIPYLKQRGAGKIIAVGSGMGRRGRVGSSAYSCAKAGLWMLVRILAQELAPHHISVNELIPGPVLTTRDAKKLKVWRARFEKLGDWVKDPKDVVPLALFMATQPKDGPTAQSFSLMRRDW
jgi:3-oxoacyl-[acyl-carrier protein] reductase